MAGMTGARAALADLLDAELPDVDVWGWPHAAEAPAARTVVVAAAAATPAPTAAGGLVAELDVWVVGALTAGEDAEDDLDEHLDAVLGVLDAHGIAWSRAERGVWQGTHPAYRIETETPR